MQTLIKQCEEYLSGVGFVKDPEPESNFFNFIPSNKEFDIFRVRICEDEFDYGAPEADAQIRHIFRENPSLIYKKGDLYYSCELIPQDGSDDYTPLFGLIILKDVNQLKFLIENGDRWRRMQLTLRLRPEPYAA